MEKNILKKISEFFINKKKYSRWQKFVGFLAAIVVFSTTYALILPAITMSKTLICPLEEHTHIDECYVQEEIMDCELDETDGHKHDDSCYLNKRNLICQKQETEGHMHGENCQLVEQILTCELQTVELQEGHTHGETCFDTEQTLLCDLEESEPVEVTVHEHIETCYIEQTTQVCELEEIEAHVHTEACYEGEVSLICELEEFEGHSHSEECSHIEKVQVCEKAEHVHGEECYASSKSDPTADVETAEIWEATFADVELTGDWAADVLAIAETQLGYKESTKNFIENELGEQSGYTRYGAWYGVPYGDWCAMFISFCLNYAEVEAFPMESNCQNWIDQLSGEDYNCYREAEEYIPNAGDLIFFDNDLDGVCHHVGLVAGVEITEEDAVSTVKVLEGNSVNDCVEYRIYELTDPKILGYGELIQPKEEVGISNNLLTYEDETMIVTATFPEEYVIPENAVLSVKLIDAQNDEETFEKMYQSVKDTMITQDNRILGSLNLYNIEMLVDEQVVEVPAEIQVLLNVAYKETLYDEEEMALAAELAVVAIEEAKMQTFGLRGSESLDGSYYATMPDANIENVSDGVTGFSMETYGLQPFGVATTYEVKKGNVWKRIEGLDEIQNEDTLLIVSLEGNTALTYGNTSKGVAVIMEQVKGNPEYYDVTLRSDNSSFAESGKYLTSKFKVTGKNGKTVKLSNLSSTNQYLRLSDGTLFNTTSTNVTLEQRTTENAWNIKYDKYYLSYDRDAKMLSSNSSQQSRRDMFLLKLVDTELLIPNDTETVNEGLTNLPDQPEYDTVTPSGEKTGNTTMEELKGFSVGYASDPATSNLEDKFTGTEDDDGKIMTDKSVIYMGDDYGAFSDYTEGTFGVTLSALGQVSSKAGEIEPLMDIVIILDTSYSMINKGSSYLDENGDMRMTWAMRAVNSVIAQALEVPENRVGVVTFSDTSQVVLPLDHYTTVNGQYLDLVADNSITDTNHGRGNNFYDLNINKNVKNSANVTPAFNFQYGPGYPNWEGTFTQSGIAEAAKILLNNTDTTDKNGNARQPVIILITDGGPTLCSSNYKDPLAGPIYGNSGQTAEGDHDKSHSANSSDGTGGNRYGINGYYTVLTAQYYKDLVGSHYDLKTKFATVGIGISSSQSSSTDKRLHDNRYCRAVLDPTAEKLNTALTTFDNFADEGKQFNQLLNNTFTKQYVSIPNHSDGYTTIGTTYSAVPVLKNPYANFDYADQYYDGKSTTLADDLISYLEKIQFQEHTWRAIIETMTDVELVDPIGRGMEVKGEPVLRFGKTNYIPTSSSVSGNVTSYVYNYAVCYRDAYPENAESDNRNTETTLDLSKIEVTVTTEGEGIDALQTVRMHVPEELLPVLYPEKYGIFYYEEYPARLIFKVGLTESAIEESMSMAPGESATYYTNGWDTKGTLSAEGNFAPYDGEDNPNTYPFDELDEQAKSSNPTETQNVYFSTVLNGNQVTQRLGNNGRLVLAKETATVSVVKKWSDTESHDPVTVHLLADGEVVEGKSVQLSEENEWTYTWSGLTKYSTDGTEIVYTVSEDYVAGYESSVEKIAKGTEYTVPEWTKVARFTKDKEYVLISQESNKALAADENTTDKYKWVEDFDISSGEGSNEEAVIWKAASTGNSSTLRNKKTQKYMSYGGSSSNNRYFNLNSSSGTQIKYSDNNLSFSLYSYYTYYFTNLNSDGYGATVRSNNQNAEKFDLYQLETTTKTYPEDTFVITNTKSEEEPLHLTIQKITDSGTVLTGAVFDLYMVENEGILTIPGAEASESKGKIVLKDITPGKDGITISIPKEDAIYYLVESKAPESFVQLKKPIRIVVKDGVISENDEMAILNGTTLSVINKAGFKLPETGGTGTLNYVLSGISLMAFAALMFIKRMKKI